jgi:hypothetical protein
MTTIRLGVLTTLLPVATLKMTRMLLSIPTLHLTTGELTLLDVLAVLAHYTTTHTRVITILIVTTLTLHLTLYLCHL